MAKRKSPNTASEPREQREAHFQECSECGSVGRVGAEMMPYSFAKNDYRWLCWQGAGKDCMVKAWQKFRGIEAP